MTNPYIIFPWKKKHERIISAKIINHCYILIERIRVLFLKYINKYKINKIVFLFQIFELAIQILEKVSET